MKSVITITLIIYAIFTLSFSGNIAQSPEKTDYGNRKEKTGFITKSTNSDTIHHWENPKNYTPLSFLERMRKKGGFEDKLSIVTMTNNFPNNWLKASDIDTLIKLVHSKVKCNCFVDPLSSYLPHQNADIGGFVIGLISAYKEKRKVSFGLYSCPETNAKAANELIKWWARQTKK